MEQTNGALMTTGVGPARGELSPAIQEPISQSKEFLAAQGALQSLKTQKKGPYDPSSIQQLNEHLTAEKLDAMSLEELSLLDQSLSTSAVSFKALKVVPGKDVQDIAKLVRETKQAREKSLITLYATRGRDMAHNTVTLTLMARCDPEALDPGTRVQFLERLSTASKIGGSRIDLEGPLRRTNLPYWAFNRDEGTVSVRIPMEYAKAFRRMEPDLWLSTPSDQPDVLVATIDARNGGLFKKLEQWRMLDPNLKDGPGSRAWWTRALDTDATKFVLPGKGVFSAPPRSRPSPSSSRPSSSPTPSHPETPPLTETVQARTKEEEFDRKIRQVNVLAQYILDKGLWKTEGPFRVPGNKGKMESLEKKLQELHSDADCLAAIKAFCESEADTGDILLGVLKHLSTDIMWNDPRFASLPTQEDRDKNPTLAVSTTRRERLHETAPVLKKLFDAITTNVKTTKLIAKTLDLAFPETDPFIRFGGGLSARVGLPPKPGTDGKRR